MTLRFFYGLALGVALSIAALNTAGTAHASVSHQRAMQTAQTTTSQVTQRLPIPAGETKARARRADVALMCFSISACQAKRCIEFAMANADDQAGRRALYDWCMTGFRLFY